MDYSDYEVHETFPDACVGDEIIAVLQNGNKGLISDLKAVSGQQTMFQVRFSESDTCAVYECEIDHYLTPTKPKKMPDHEGLWRDKDGDLWVYDGCNLRLVKSEAGWTITGIFNSPEFTKRYAPFTELEVKEKEH